MTSAEQRLSVGLLVNYTRSGRSVAEATRLTMDDISALRPMIHCELLRYVYRDKQSGERVFTEAAFQDALTHLSGAIEQTTAADAVELLRDLATYICEKYEIAMLERRRRVRREEDSSAAAQLTR